MRPYRILVVDDEEDLCEILQYNLASNGYEVDVANSAEEALKLDLIKYDLLLLDVMMGEISGFRMARIVREQPKLSKIPIIFVTAKVSQNDRLTGFTVGADDYILKPFSVRELVARVKAVLRRFEHTRSEVLVENISFEGLEMLVESRKVLLDKQEIPCTKKEFEILKIFLENKNRVFTREEILQRVWSEDVYVQDRIIDVNINRLRKKIGKYGKNVVTRLGYGYCFEDS